MYLENGTITLSDFNSSKFVRVYNICDKIIVPYFDKLLILKLDNYTTVHLFKFDNLITEHNILEYTIYNTLRCSVGEKDSLYLLELFCSCFGKSVLYEGIEYFLFPDIATCCNLTTQDLFFIHDLDLIKNILNNVNVLYKHRNLFSLRYGLRTSRYLSEFIGIDNCGIDLIKFYCLGDLSTVPIDNYLKKLLFKLFGTNIISNDKIIECIDSKRGNKTRGEYYYTLLLDSFK